MAYLFHNLFIFTYWLVVLLQHMFTNEKITYVLKKKNEFEKFI